MLNITRKIIREYFPESLKAKLRIITLDFLDGYSLKSYSQEGEDMLLRRIFEKQTTGFYVDVGAHHPKRFSNTYFFYKKGWRGINIDANPGSMEKFKKHRAKDINLEIAVSDKEEELIYYAFNEPALNGFSKRISDSRNGVGDYKIISSQKIKTRRLGEILDEYIPSSNIIDFISIDVEGLDLQVLKSNFWDRYYPKIVLCEALDFNMKRMEESELYRFMIDKDYFLFAKTVNTLIFMSNSEK
jgi:FkbM family methyltransferase